MMVSAWGGVNCFHSTQSKRPDIIGLWNVTPFI